MENSVKYGVLVPKLSGSSVLYKDLIIFEIQNDKILRATKFDYNMNVIQTDCWFEDKNKIVNSSKIKNRYDFFNNTDRVIIVFDYLIMAFLQKIIFIQNIKHFFIKTKEKEIEDFLKQIPPKIDEIVETQKTKNPEYFL